MLKREISYEDFNGNKVTEIFYFNISKPELIEMEVEYDQGFGVMIQGVIEAKNHKELIKHFKEIVLMAYGQKSEDGKRFIKTKELRDEFASTAAYIELFTELATDDGAASTFLRGTLPRDMVGDLDKAIAAVPTETLSAVPLIPPTS